jgi:transposase
LSLLLRYHDGERDVWSVVNVSGPEDEDRRRPYRDHDQLVRERTEHTNRIKGLLATIGLDVTVDGRLLERVAALRQ